ncbi:MAG: hypothetical protein ACJAS2_001064 [Pseudohongiellaceae bacterium]|jgi:hypothetical protein
MPSFNRVYSDIIQLGFAAHIFIFISLIKRLKIKGMSHQLVKAKLKRIITKYFQIIYIEKYTLVEIVIKIIGHKRTDKRAGEAFILQ